MRLALLLVLSAASAPGDAPLREQIETIASDARGQVSVACSLPGSTLDCALHPRAHPPMQSVFKLPLAIAVLDRVERGRLSLDQPVRFLPSDRILPRTHSPLQDRHPDGDVDVTLRELLELSVSASDNVAADILLRLLGGPRALDAFAMLLGAVIAAQGRLPAPSGRSGGSRSTVRDRARPARGRYELLAFASCS